MKLFLFDMDGTLVDSLHSIAYFVNRTLQKFGFSTIEVNDYRFLVGDGSKVLIKRAIAKVGGDESLSDTVHEQYCRAYDNDYMYLTDAYIGVIEVLTKIKEKGHKIAIVSNKPHSTTQRISDELFGDLVDVCIGKREGVPLKPDPASVNEIIDTFKIPKEDCYYFGDTLVDMQTGANAGIYTVGVLWGFRDIDELKSGNPQKIIDSPFEILTLLCEE